MGVGHNAQNGVDAVLVFVHRHDLMAELVQLLCDVGGQIDPNPISKIDFMVCTFLYPTVMRSCGSRAALLLLPESAA